jgi:chromosome segregation ATPase
LHHPEQRLERRLIIDNKEDFQDYFLIIDNEIVLITHPCWRQAAIIALGPVKYTMATLKWDAYRYLNITSRDSHGTSCAGYTKYGQRCRWDISAKNFSRICSILDDFETKAPAKAVSSLGRLAQLSLCEKYHQSQASKKVGEWKVAIQEATKFYERSKALKKKNRELNEMLTEERSEREELEEKIEEEISRRKQELESISSMTLEVSSLKAKLKQAETEARNSKDTAQKKSKLYNKREAELNDRISKLCKDWSDKKLDFETRLKEEAQTSHSTRSELEKLRESESRLVNQVSELTLQLETELHAKSTLQSDLNQIKDERNLVLLQKDEFESQLTRAAERIDQMELNMKEAEAAREILSQDEQHAHDQKIKIVNHAKVVLEETNKLLFHEVETLLLSEQGNAAELRQSLQTATDNLSRTDTQLRKIKEDLSHKKDELEMLQVEFAKAGEEFEEERRKVSVHQVVSLSRMDELIQEMARAKLHPFRTLCANLFEISFDWVKSVFACFGRLRPRRGLDSLTAEENMSSP